MRAPVRKSPRPRSTASTADSTGTLNPARQPRFYEEVCERILDIVRREKLKPGQRLPPERSLAHELRVSRTSIREAMIALETARIIEVRLGSGCYLSVLVGQDFRLPWTDRRDHSPGAIEQFEVRKLIEPRIAQLAAKHISRDEILELEALLDADGRAIAASKPGDQEGAEFHIRLAELSRNSILARTIRELMALRTGEMWRTLRTRVIKPEMRLQSLFDRRQIVDALKAGDGRQARHAVEQLLRRAEKWFFTG